VTVGSGAWFLVVIREKVLNITSKFSADYQSGQDNSGALYPGMAGP
jgi:hypothetical protein